MRFLGIIFIAISVFIIITNVAKTKDAEYEMENHPWITILSGGSNLPQGSYYTFKFPLTTYEKAIYILGGVGIFLVIIGGNRRDSDS